MGLGMVAQFVTQVVDDVDGDHEFVGVVIHVVHIHQDVTLMHVDFKIVFERNARRLGHQNARTMLLFHVVDEGSSCVLA